MMSGSVESNPMRRKAVFQLMLATAAWGISFPLFKMLFDVQKAHVPGVDTFFLAAHAIGTRAVGAAAFFLILRPRLLSGLTRKEWRQGLLLGFFGGSGLIFQADGMNYTSASVSAFLTQFYCVLLPLWVCLRRREWLSPRLLIATLLVVGGVSILSGLVKVENGTLEVQEFHLGRGELETLISACFFTVQILLLERPAWKANRMIPVSVLMFFGFAACAFPVVILTKPSWSAVTGVYQNDQDFLIIGAVILFCTVYAYTAMNRWQPHVSATEGGLIYCLEPVFTAIYTLFLPGWLAVWTGVPYANEVLTVTTLAGGGLITVANIILQLPQRRAKAKP
ncbi:MAG TPA: DMT family transporter [Verrucomicrobiales bacterium]|nr:DMT family transporter [Verrucomicrobiales bacterium]